MLHLGYVIMWLELELSHKSVLGPQRERYHQIFTEVDGYFRITIGLLSVHENITQYTVVIVFFTTLVEGYFRIILKCLSILSILNSVFLLEFE